MRMTNQKKILNDEVKRFNSFFDAPTLHKKLRSKNIGLATIYRFLNALEQEGSIHSFTCENRKIYSTDKTSHAHFRCERCGKSKHIRKSTRLNSSHMSI